MIRQVTIQDFPASWQEATPHERSHDSRTYTERFMLRLDTTSSLKLQELVHRFDVPKAARARFTNGVLEPLERFDVPEGEVLTITIIRLPVNEGGRGLERSAGGWKGLIDAEELKRNIYADRMISTRPEPRL
jgi:predicted DNA-binding antitoxin AbrB/MazE fold protein